MLSESFDDESDGAKWFSFGSNFFLNFISAVVAGETFLGFKPEIAAEAEKSDYPSCHFPAFLTEFMFH